MERIWNPGMGLPLPQGIIQVYNHNLQSKICRAWANRQKFYAYENILSSPGGRLPLPRGYIHVYDHNIQTSSLKLLGQSNQT